MRDQAYAALGESSARLAKGPQCAALRMQVVVPDAKKHAHTAAQLVQLDASVDDAPGGAVQHYLGRAAEAHRNFLPGLLRWAPHSPVGWPRGAHGQEPSSTAPSHSMDL